MHSSFTSLKDLILPRARKLPVGHALESAYVTEVAKKHICTFFNISDPRKDITSILFSRNVLHISVTSAAFANELKNRETEILEVLKKELPQAVFENIRIKIG